MSHLAQVQQRVHKAVYSTEKYKYPIDLLPKFYEGLKFQDTCLD